MRLAFPARAVRLRARVAAISFLLMTSLIPLAGNGEGLPAHIGSSVVVLTGPWKFHPGDDRAWAAKDFDDSAWGTQDLTPPERSFDPITGSSGYVPGWTAQKHPKLSGYAWYRMRIDVSNETWSENMRAGSGALALAMPLNFDDAYQVFVNGQLLGQFGDFDSKPVNFFNAQPRAFELPASVRSGPVEIAIRFWMDEGTGLLSEDAGGLHGPPMLGEAKSIDAMLRLEWDSVNRTEMPNLLTCAISILVAVLGLTLYWLDRHEPAYLWLGLACVAQLAARSMVLTGYYTVMLPMVWETILQDVLLQPLNMGLWALFWASWFRLEHARRIRRIALGLVVAQGVAIATLRPPFYGSLIPVGASGWLIPVSLVLKLAVGGLLIWITFRGIQKRASGSWLAMVPIVLTVIWGYQEELSIIHLAPVMRLGGITLTLGQIANELMLAIVSILLMERFVRGQREREHWRQEIEHARQVQQVLIPEELPSVRGFALESEYRPAQQVGGDFFQILPLREGGVLAVIGDVSGKGMPAAMTVSLLVGTLRTLAEFTTSPGEILTGMNARMLSRSESGFTTCLVMRVEPNGRCFIANAGHLAPYREGQEIEVASGLPLGLSKDTTYPETTLRLEMGQQLTLLTDGVVEARGRKGELLGFEKTAEMALLSAEAIAQAAQEFGQEDDITVLTVKRLQMNQEPAIRVATSVLAADLA
jgi:hypothetical protein